MRGLILAAGRGRRMGAAGDEQPKCATRLGGRTLLDWQLEAMATAGIKEVALVTGYRADALSGHGLQQFHNPDWATTNMVASLWRARPWLMSGPCVVSYADIVYGAAAVELFMAADPRPLALTYHTGWRSLWEARFADPLADAERFEVEPGAGRLRAIGGRSTSMDEIEGQYMGLVKYTPAGVEALEACFGPEPGERKQDLDMTSLLARALSRGIEISALAHDGLFCEVDSEADLRLYEARGWYPNAGLAEVRAR